MSKMYLTTFVSQHVSGDMDDPYSPVTMEVLGTNIPITFEATAREVLEVSTPVFTMDFSTAYNLALQGITVTRKLWLENSISNFYLPVRHIPIADALATDWVVVYD